MGKEETEKKQIIFLEPWSEIMTYKIARLFKKNGYSTYAIRILESKGLSDNFFKDAFDEIISFNVNFYKINRKNIFPIIKMFFNKRKDVFLALRSISKLKPYVIFARAKPSWPYALTKILFKKIPMIY